uniref:Uncharacterized protein n=2 Tax=unclassified Caudoviricetes TaxID=2788787 RepID=A0A8S5PI43_9CAUD|nr:MAG TPA: hypothetical protein [Siphoviridae sp. ctJcm18]DAE06578.1 MAG TPA: hypothetical protein [Siphoviridae sp. ctUGQ45]DAV73389.1 MAG TPA: hypothetical protein [Bacteriophage sp.]
MFRVLSSLIQITLLILKQEHLRHFSFYIFHLIHEYF